MIEKVDEDLKDWASALLGNVSVTLAPPSTVGDGKGVSLYLLQIEPAPSHRPVRDEPPLRAALHYLVTPFAKDPAEMHRMLSDLFFGALENPQWQIEPAAPPTELWQSLGLAARPAFILRAYAVKEQKPKPVRFVKSMQLQTAPLRPLHGILRGPGEVAIMGATVQVPALNLAAQTDHAGRFAFAAVPANSALEKIRVNVKGRTWDYTSVPLPRGDEPLLLQLNANQLPS